MNTLIFQWCVSEQAVLHPGTGVQQKHEQIHVSLSEPLVKEQKDTFIYNQAAGSGFPVR